MGTKRSSTSSRTPSPGIAYWTTRLSSREFHRALETSLEAELRHLATLKLTDVVEPSVVSGIIDEIDASTFHQDVVVDVVLAVVEAVSRSLRRSRISPKELLGSHASRDIETLIFDRTDLSDDAEGFLADLMQQEFTELLFTEIIFTSIVSFNKKVNPLFGGFAMRAMEDQIRSFIRLFMPMVQKQAAAFAVDNQSALRDLTRQILQDSLRRPLGELVREPSTQRRQAGHNLLQHGLASEELDKLIRSCALVGWQAALSLLGDRRLGEIVHLEKHAKAWARRAAEVLTPLLTHAPIVELVAREADRFHQNHESATQAPPKKRTTRVRDDESR